MLDWLAPRADLRMVDVGGGTGDITFRWLERSGGPVNVVDYSPEMIGRRPRPRHRQRYSKRHHMERWQRPKRSLCQTILLMFTPALFVCEMSRASTKH